MPKSNYEIQEEKLFEKVTPIEHDDDIRRRPHEQTFILISFLCRFYFVVWAG